jgi:hypothetical protein
MIQSHSVEVLPASKTSEAAPYVDHRSNRSSAHNQSQLLPHIINNTVCSDAGYPWKVTNMKPTGMVYSASLREMSNRVRNRYPSTTADYKVNDTGMFMYRYDRYLTKWSREKQVKNTYIDQIFAKGSKKERSSPPPNAYKPDAISIEKPRSVS